MEQTGEMITHVDVTHEKSEFKPGKTYWLWITVTDAKQENIKCLCFEFEKMYNLVDFADPVILQKAIYKQIGGFPHA